MSEKIKDVLSCLRDVRLSPTEFLFNLYSSEQDDFSAYKQKLFDDGNQGHLLNFLNSLWADPRGQHILESWLHGPAVDYAAKCVAREFEAAKPHLWMNSKDVSVEYMQSWSLDQMVKPSSFPVWSRILDAASETEKAHISGHLVCRL